MIQVVNMTKMETAANDWMLAQCEGSGVHYRQDGDAASTCGDRLSNHTTTARDFVTCKSCLATLRGPPKVCDEPLLRTDAKAA
jgi:hypothetical protein